MKNIYDDTMNNNEPDYEGNLVFPPQEESVEKKCEKLEEQNNKLKQVIDDLDGRKCPKCGKYHHRDYVCWNCGYDYTAPKELDK